MANICDFIMIIKGSSNNLQEFVNAMTQTGDIWMGRGASVKIVGKEYEENKSDIKRWQLFGDCKWSIQSSLVDNAVSMRTDPDRWCGIDNVKEFITLWEAAKRWDIEFEVFSEEPGCCFQEHYSYIDGCEREDVCDYYEYDLLGFDTVEEAEEELDIDIYPAAWEKRYVCDGGFEWDFEI